MIAWALSNSKLLVAHISEEITLTRYSSSGKILNATLTSNSELHGLRASFDLDPNAADLIELRLRVMRGDAPVSETWLYRWTSS